MFSNLLLIFLLPLVDAKLPTSGRLAAALGEKKTTPRPRFLRPDEIPGQLLSSEQKKAKDRPNGRETNRVATLPPSSSNAKSALAGQKYGSRGSRRQQVVMPLISLMPPLIALPSDATVQGALTFGATYPIRGFQTLDTNEQNEIDNELGSVGVSRRVQTADTPVGPVPRFKVTYFDARGIAECIRLIFVYANESFVDERLSKKQWLRMKDHTLYGKLPLLEVDGKILGQGYSIVRWLARKFGLEGVDEWDKARVDEAAEFHRQVFTDSSPYLLVLGGFREGNKEQLRRDVFLPAVDKHFSIYVQLLDESKSGFFSKRVSYADFMISEYFYTVHRFEPFLLKKYPQLVAFMERVRQLPPLVKYIRHRSETPLMS
ncbi:GST protein [Aphelenchoides fujianensis]|nr:GST protein [Aphelenchoides fujianensis]